MPHVLIFVMGLSVGFLAQRYTFCIFGSLVELLTLGSVRRVAGVLAAMLVFALVNISGYRHSIEYPAPIFLAGGLVQGVGYYMAVGCPLGLLVRIGEGSKMHLVVFVSFLAGIALYTGVLAGPASALLGPVESQRVVTLIDFFRL